MSCRMEVLDRSRVDYGMDMEATANPTPKFETLDEIVEWVADEALCSVFGTGPWAPVTHSETHGDITVTITDEREPDIDAVSFTVTKAGVDGVIASGTATRLRVGVIVEFDGF